MTEQHQRSQLQLVPDQVPDGEPTIQHNITTTQAMEAMLTTILTGVDSRNSPKSAHAHHWVIEPPDGQLSTGMCRLCREERTFQNCLSTGTVTSRYHRKP